MSKFNTLSNGSKAATKDTLKTPAKTRFIEFCYVTLEEFAKRFQRYIFNRGLPDGVDHKRAKDIAREIVTFGTYWLINPILINRRTKTMVDGHTTLEALMILRDEYQILLDVPVCIIDVPKGVSDAQAIQMFNNIGLSWKLSMYVANYALEGNSNYQNLIEMCQALPEGYFHKGEENLFRNTSALSGKGQQDNLRYGNYILTEEDMKAQKDFGMTVNDILTAAGAPKSGQWTESFIIALHKLKEEMGKGFKTEKLIRLLSANENNERGIFNGSTSTRYWKDNISDLLTA